MKVTGEIKSKTGTETQFLPDTEIFKKTRFKFDILSQRLMELAFLNKGLKIRLKDERTDTEKEFHAKGGLKEFVDYLKSLKPDLLVCCHGRQILKEDLLSIGCINLHPCLYKYKGADPIVRLLADKETRASVGVHWMRKEVDEGEVIVERFLEVDGSGVVEVYNQLYPLYSQALVEALNRIKENNLKT